MSKPTLLLLCLLGSYTNAQLASSAGNKANWIPPAGATTQITNHFTLPTPPQHAQPKVSPYSVPAGALPAGATNGNTLSLNTESSLKKVIQEQTNVISQIANQIKSLEKRLIELEKANKK
jgi:hypothetical protein